MIGMDVICDQAGFLLRISVTLVKYIRILIPILLIILITFDLVKVFTNPQMDEKVKRDATQKAVKRFIYAIIIFLVPSIIIFIFNRIEDISKKDMPNGVSTTSSSWISCWLAEYNGTATYTKKNNSNAVVVVTPIATPTPKVVITPTPTAPPRPVLTNTYAYNPFTELKKLNPSQTSQAVEWTGDWNYYLGLHLEVGNANRLAYAGSRSLADIRNTQLSDFTVGDGRSGGKCDVGIDMNGFYVIKIQETGYLSKCINNMSRVVNSSSPNAKGNFAFDLDELDVYADDVTKKCDRKDAGCPDGNKTAAHSSLAIEYYVGVWTVNSYNVMSEPTIFKIKTDGSVNQKNWVVTKVQ